MAPYSSTLAWKILWTEEPGRLQSMGSLRVGHDWATSLSLFTFMLWRRKWQPTPVFLPGESQGRGSLVAAVCGVTQSWIQLKWLSSSSSSSSSSIMVYGASLVVQRWRICLQCRRCRKLGFDPWVRKIPWRWKWQPTSVFLPGESPEQRSLAGYSPWGCKELDVTETTEHAHIMIYNLSALLILCTQIHTHFPYMFYSIIANAELMNTELLLLGEIQG